MGLEVVELPVILLLLFQCDRRTILDLRGLVHILMQQPSSIQSNEFEALTRAVIPVHQLSDE